MASAASATAPAVDAPVAVTPAGVDDAGNETGPSAINATQIGGATRFYEQRFPNLEETVIAQVRAVAVSGGGLREGGGQSGKGAAE